MLDVHPNCVIHVRQDILEAEVGVEDNRATTIV